MPHGKLIVTCEGGFLMVQDHTYLRLHQLSGPTLLVNLQEKGRAILEEARLASVGRAAETLAKEGSLRLTIIGFTAGSALADHRANGPVSIEVLEGQIAVTTADGTTNVTKGEALVIEADVRHSVVARTDSVVLLSIALNSPPAN
jgi:quercetin dioxygenase-like cupin family protein